MKQFTKTILFLYALSSLNLTYAQNDMINKTVVRTIESSTTKKDSAGIHYITTILKDSIVGDSTYCTKIVSTKTHKGNSEITQKTISTVRKLTEQTKK